MEQSLEQFVESVNGASHLRVEHDFGGGYVRLRTSEAERRQAAQDIRCTEDIVLELLRNSRDAHASHIFVATAKEGSKRILTVIDDGDGIPRSMHKLVFEPRVTSKLDTSHMDAWGMHGRGMALYSIATNAQEARIAVSEREVGCAMCIQTDTTRLPERKDQSTFPKFELADNSQVNVRGPKNILRTVCEFAIECRAACSVFIGSPAEVASTLYAYGEATLSPIDRLFSRDVHAIPIPKRLARAGDPTTLSRESFEMGLSISERTARRILDGEVKEVAPILDRIQIGQSPSKKRDGKRTGSPIDNRGFKLHVEDAAMLSQALKPAFREIAERYYLEDDVTPIVRSRKDRITVTIPIVKLP